MRWCALVLVLAACRDEAPPAIEALTVAPAKLDFGLVAVGRNHTLPLQVTNRGPARLALREPLVVQNTKVFTVVSWVSELGPAQLAELEVMYAPRDDETTSSPHRGELALQITGEAPTLEVPLVGLAAIE